MMLQTIMYLKGIRIMKKKLFPVISLVLAAVSLSAAAVLWGQVVRYKADIADLTHLVEDLNREVAGLSGRPADLSLGEITLTARLRNDGLAEVSFTLTPSHAPEAEASLKILTGDAVAAEAPCQWDGDAYCAQAELIPANDCTYVLTLGGTEYLLASPTNGAYPDLVNLADSLSAYCNLILGDWIVEGGLLTVDVCHLHVQAPRLGILDLPLSQEAHIHLKHRGDLLDSAIVYVQQGEGAASYESTIHQLSLAVPALAEDDEVEMWMEAILPDGQLVSVCAGTWTFTADGWTMAAG